MTLKAADHASTVNNAIAAGAAARSAVVASWERCIRVYGLDPAGQAPRHILSDADYRRSRERVGPLVGIAQTNLDRLEPIVQRGGCCALLADPEGVAIEGRGAASDAPELRRMALVPGATWSEQVGGTNGIGTCVVEKRPLVVHLDQHFYAANGAISCVAAPIFDHRGQLAAVLNISVYRDDAQSTLLVLAGLAANEMAKQIEAEHFRQSFQFARIVWSGGAQSFALLALDGDGFVVGASRAARLALRISDHAIEKGLPAEDLLMGPISSRVDLVDAQRAAFRRALARTAGNVSKAAVQLGLSRATLKRRLQQFAVKPKGGRP